MSWILLSNDDGVDSPALLPFADALARALDLPVRVCVPSSERSWSGKAVTRRGNVRTGTVRRDDRAVVTVDGTPADAVQLGMYRVFAAEFAGAPPTAVVTGINLGYNGGTGFLASSGTVWGAAEASLAGLPAIAVSTGPASGMTDWVDWRAEVHDPTATPGWHRLAAVAATTVRDIADTDLVDHCDLVSVNLPWTTDATSPRRVTQLTPMAYGPLFDAVDGDDAVFSFTDDLTVHLGATADDGDVETLHAGGVSITPVLLPRSSTVPERTRRALESDTT